jgi:hypothetical protein
LVVPNNSSPAAESPPSHNQGEADSALQQARLDGRAPIALASRFATAFARIYPGLS